MRCLVTSDETADVSNAFVDMQMRRWVLELTVGLAQDIRRLESIDLLNAHNGQAITKLAADDERLVRVLWMIIEPRATQLDVTPEDFARSLGGETLGAGMQALEEAIILFTPPARRLAIRKLVDKAREVQQRAFDLMTTKLNSATTTKAIESHLRRSGERFDRQLEQSLQSTANILPTSGQGSSE